MQRFSVYSSPLDVHPNTPPTHQCIPPFDAHSSSATDNQSLSFLPAHLLTPQWQPINVYHYARAPFASSAAPSFVLFMLSGFNVPWQCGNVTRYSQHATSCHCIFCIRTPHRQSSVQPSHPYTAPPVSAPPYTFTATAFICSTAPLLIHFRFQSSAVLLAASSLLSPRSRRRHSCQVSSPLAAAYFRDGRSRSP